MKKYILLLFTLPLLVFGQTAKTPSQADITKAYVEVIAEYIKAESKNLTFNFDTLYIGKHDEFPDIKLPNTISDKKIILLTYHDGDKEPQNNKTFVLINIIESHIAKEYASFMLVTFHKDYRPQHNTHVDLKYNTSKKEFELDKTIRYDYRYNISK